MDIQLVDVTLHVDENLTREVRAEVENALRSMDGVVSVHNSHAKPHLIVVEYNPKKANSHDLLDRVQAQGVHAELIGL